MSHDEISEPRPCPIEDCDGRHDVFETRALSHSFATLAAISIAALLIGTALGVLALLFVWVWSAVFQVAS